MLSGVLKLLSLMRIPRKESHSGRCVIQLLFFSCDYPANSGRLLQRIRAFEFKVFITSPEQLGRHEDHLTEFGSCMKNDKFAHKISRVSIDEGHHIYTSGTSYNGRPAFRPAYACIQKFIIKLKPKVPVQILSATIPPHVRHCIIDKLSLHNPADIRLTTNRSNTIYWTFPIEDSLNNFANLDFLIPVGVTEEDVRSMEPILIFYDSREGSRKLARYLNSRFPPGMQNPRQARHYNSYMSREYLEKAYEDFNNGLFKIFVCTDGASQVHVLIDQFKIELTQCAL
jgi:superfamily II DNA helicase RecQ